MIVNKQASKSSNIGQANIEKTDILAPQQKFLSFIGQVTFLCSY